MKKEKTGIATLSMKESLLTVVFATGVIFTVASAVAAQNGQLGLDVLLNTELTDGIIAELELYGKVLNELREIDAVTMRVRQSDVSAIEALPFVDAAVPDAVRHGGPIDSVDAENFADGWGTWDLDAVDIMVDPIGWTREPGLGGMDGDGVYVAVLDTGLLSTWRRYFPEQCIASEYARCFGGGGGERGYVSEQPNKWERDTDSHGTHVTSTILGYDFFGDPINGVAPLATIIPVKVLNQNGWGWSSVIAQGILYVAELKEGPLADYPVVINMSLGGPVQDPVEKAAIDYAIARGVIIVASAGNNGAFGMGYPGAYAPVISVAASGWAWEWIPAPGDLPWWWGRDVADPTDPADFYIANWSSRAHPGQDLDVAAPGSWVVGPYQLQMGQISYCFLGGTSMASPHVAGIVALMAQKYPALTAPEAESILESTAIPLPPGSQTVQTPWGMPETHSWGADATGAGLVTATGALAATP